MGYCLSRGALTIGQLRPGGPRSLGESSGFLPSCPAMLHRQKRRDGEQELQPARVRVTPCRSSPPAALRKADTGTRGGTKDVSEHSGGAYLPGATSAQLPPPTRGDRGAAAFAYQTQLQPWQTWRCSELKGSPSEVTPLDSAAPTRLELTRSACEGRVRFPTFLQCLSLPRKEKPEDGEGRRFSKVSGLFLYSKFATFGLSFLFGNMSATRKDLKFWKI